MHNRSSKWPPFSKLNAKIKKGNLDTIEMVVTYEDDLEITVPINSIKMPGRLEPLLDVMKIAYWHSKYISSIQQKYVVQFQDEEPSQKSLVFDAAKTIITTMIPDPYALATSGYKNLRESQLFNQLPEWKKRQDIITWRGSTTGFNRLELDNINRNARFRLCKVFNEMGIKSDVKFSQVVQASTPRETEIIKDYLKQIGIFSNEITPTDMSASKWIIDIDGNVNSWGFLWKLLSGSCVIKVESCRKQWFYDSVQPFIHYVPIKEDLSDIQEICLWCLENQSQCEWIAENGKNLANKISNNIGRSVIDAIRRY